MCILKVLDHITLEKKCLNFKIRSVFMKVADAKAQKEKTTDLNLVLK